MAMDPTIDSPATGEGPQGAGVGTGVGVGVGERVGTGEGIGVGAGLGVETGVGVCDGVGVGDWLPHTFSVVLMLRGATAPVAKSFPF